MAAELMCGVPGQDSRPNAGPVSQDRTGWRNGAWCPGLFVYLQRFLQTVSRLTQNFTIMETQPLLIYFYFWRRERSQETAGVAKHKAVKLVFFRFSLDMSLAALC